MVEGLGRMLTRILSHGRRESTEAQASRHEDEVQAIQQLEALTVRAEVQLGRRIQRPWEEAGYYGPDVRNNLP